VVISGLYLAFNISQKKEKGQIVGRKDMDVNEHEKLSNITLRHKLK
jgi:hypothetical protein